jgi:hypothetical protein
MMHRTVNVKKVILITFCLQLYPRVQTSKKAVEWLSQQQKPSLQRVVLLWRLSKHTSTCYNVHIFFFLRFWYKSEMRCDYESQVAYRTYTVQQVQVMFGDFKEMFWNEIVYLIAVLKVILCPVLYIYTHTYTNIYRYTVPCFRHVPNNSVFAIWDVHNSNGKV